MYKNEGQNATVVVKLQKQKLVLTIVQMETTEDYFKGSAWMLNGNVTPWLLTFQCSM